MVTERAWEAFGYRLGYRSPTRALDDILTRVVLPNWVEVPPESAEAWIELRDDQLYDNGTYWTTVTNDEQLCLRLQQATQMRLTWSAEKVLFLHCGVVKVEQKAWLFPGDSKAGKSTLVHALCERGAVFYSDEYAVLDRSGLVYPYPRPLWIRVTHKKRRSIEPGSLGWTRDLKPVPVSRVYLCPYSKLGAVELRKLSIEEAVEECSVFLRCSPSRRSEAHEWLATALATAELAQGRRGEAQGFVENLF